MPDIVEKARLQNRILKCRSVIIIPSDTEFKISFQSNWDWARLVFEVFIIR